MCCASSEYRMDQIDGQCPDCGQSTVDGDAYEQCYYSPVECTTCGWAPCDLSC